MSSRGNRVVADPSVSYYTVDSPSEKFHGWNYPNYHLDRLADPKDNARAADAFPLKYSEFRAGVYTCNSDNFHGQQPSPEALQAFWTYVVHRHFEHASETAKLRALMSIYPNDPEERAKVAQKIKKERNHDKNFKRDRRPSCASGQENPKKNILKKEELPLDNERSTSRTLSEIPEAPTRTRQNSTLLLRNNPCHVSHRIQSAEDRLKLNGELATQLPTATSKITSGDIPGPKFGVLISGMKQEWSLHWTDQTAKWTEFRQIFDTVCVEQDTQLPTDVQIQLRSEYALRNKFVRLCFSSIDAQEVAIRLLRRKMPSTTIQPYPSHRGTCLEATISMENAASQDCGTIHKNSRLAYPGSQTRPFEPDAEEESNLQAPGINFGASSQRDPGIGKAQDTEIGVLITDISEWTAESSKIGQLMKDFEPVLIEASSELTADHRQYLVLNYGLRDEFIRISVKSTEYQQMALRVLRQGVGRLLIQPFPGNKQTRQEAVQARKRQQHLETTPNFTIQSANETPDALQSFNSIGRSTNNPVTTALSEQKAVLDHGFVISSHPQIVPQNVDCFLEPDRTRDNASKIGVLVSGLYSVKKAVIIGLLADIELVSVEYCSQMPPWRQQELKDRCEPKHQFFLISIASKEDQLIAIRILRQRLAQHLVQPFPGEIGTVDDVPKAQAGFQQVPKWLTGDNASISVTTGVERNFSRAKAELVSRRSSVCAINSGAGQKATNMLSYREHRTTSAAPSYGSSVSQDTPLKDLLQRTQREGEHKNQDRAISLPQVYNSDETFRPSSFVQDPVARAVRQTTTVTNDPNCKAIAEKRTARIEEVAKPQQTQYSQHTQDQTVVMQDEELPELEVTNVRRDNLKVKTKLPREGLQSEHQSGEESGVQESKTRRTKGPKKRKHRPDSDADTGNVSHLGLKESVAKAKKKKTSKRHKSELESKEEDADAVAIPDDGEQTTEKKKKSKKRRSTLGQPEPTPEPTPEDEEVENMGTGSVGDEPVETPMKKSKKSSISGASTAVDHLLEILEEDHSEAESERGVRDTSRSRMPSSSNKTKVGEKEKDNETVKCGRVEKGKKQQNMDWYVRLANALKKVRQELVGDERELFEALLARPA